MPEMKWTPAPGWPKPENDNWYPPPGWRPHPSWPAAPTDWDFWRPTEAEETSGGLASAQAATTSPEGSYKWSGEAWVRTESWRPSSPPPPLTLHATTGARTSGKVSKVQRLAQVGACAVILLGVAGVLGLLETSPSEADLACPTSDERKRQAAYQALDPEDPSRVPTCAQLEALQLQTSNDDVVVETEDSDIYIQAYRDGYLWSRMSGQPYPICGNTVMTVQGVPTRGHPEAMAGCQAAADDYARGVTARY